MLIPKQQADFASRDRGSSLDHSIVDQVASRLGRDTAADAGTAALAQLARLLGRSAAADHHRRGRGFSVWEVVIPLAMVGLVIDFLLHVLAAR